MIPDLRAEKINTWFDLGLFIDRFKENRKVPSTQFQGSYDDFLKSISNGGVSIITFCFSVDGASMESQKYARAIREIFSNIPIHYIAAKFYENGELFLLPDAKRFEVPEMASFEDWPLYQDFFFNKLERGGKTYNELIIKFWKQVLSLTEKLGRYIEDNDIQLLYLINTNSNPGNVALALALVFISEYLGLPVINNNHDFYWEGGHSEIDIQKGIKPGPRDHFFTNYHLGEIFSVLEMIYPWESRSWLSVNINEMQSAQLIRMHGHNPANVTNINTAIDFEKFHVVKNSNRKKEIFRQLALIFSGYKEKTPVYSVSQLLKSNIQSMDTLKPMLIGIQRQNHIDFERDNLILLQPTRIIRRKKIQVGFTLLKKLFEDDEFIEYFNNNKNLKITILVTGPVATGHLGYFLKLLKRFNKMLIGLDKKYSERILLCFLFSEFDKPSYKNRFKNPVSFEEVFSIASLVLLPSQTEGRGLPIIEAAACGIPIFCRRYEPQEVYAHVIGEHLPKSDRLAVIEFTDPELNSEIIESVKRQLFSPKGFQFNKDHNLDVVQRRYNFPGLINEFKNIFYKLFLQVTSEPDAEWLAKWAHEEFQQHINSNKAFVENLLKTEHRQYLPGYGQMAFMIFLKSLIDPSYFRVEEKRIRGMAMQFAKELVVASPNPTLMPIEMMHQFYNSVDSIFLRREGEIKLRMDHSMAYRHRNKNYYPYRDYTPQELTGMINYLYNKVATPPPVIKIDGKEDIGSDWNRNLSKLYDDVKLEIDHVEELEAHLEKNIPIAYFPGDHFELELELFVLYPVRRKLGLMKGEKIHDCFLDHIKLEPIYIIQHEHPQGNSVPAKILKSYVYYGDNTELKILFKHGVCKIISSQQHCPGIHFQELGKEAGDVLQIVQEHNGILIAMGDHAAMMTDIADINRFHIGKISNLLAEKIMGIPFGSGYVQWVPPGLRFALAYPSPVQTGKDFSNTLKSFRFKKLCDEMGEDRVLEILKKDAEEKGTPINLVLKELTNQKVKQLDVTSTSLNGLYSDGLPWAGVSAHIKMSKSNKKWRFSVVSTKDKPKTVLQFVQEFNQTYGKNAKIACNGGYILNPELVGKLGIPEKFIGSPLGMIISNGRVLSLPLFNKPSFIVMTDGSVHVKRVNCWPGILIKNKSETIRLTPDTYNLKEPISAPCFYDLLYPGSQIPGNGRILVRLAGNTIKDIIHTKEGEHVPVLPVGLILSFPRNDFPKNWNIGKQLELEINGWDKVEAAIEAGPQLLKDGDICIDMELEGWKTQNSINTQAARLDFIDMRGPKIAIGIDSKGDLSILTVNGRIRESVGATHHDMAQILKEQGMIHAMGFDPGGSATLVVDNKTLNISPYNHEYEKDVYSLPPEPRAVANAIIVWQET